MVTCAWPCLNEGCQCEVCGYALKRDFAVVPHRECGSQPPPCEWLGSAIDTIAIVKCKTCRGNVRLKMAVHDCALFGACLPKAAGDVAAQGGTSYHGCIGCNRNPANPPTTTPPATQG